MKHTLLALALIVGIIVAHSGNIVAAIIFAAVMFGALTATKGAVR